MRRKSREVALQILFQTEFAPQINYQQFLDVFEDQAPYTKEVLAFADLLIQGVQSNKNEIDAQISSCAAHWKMDRMASIDRNILRVATFELNFANEKLSPGVIINEAVEIAKLFSTPESASFVNGILDQVAKRKG